MPRQVDYYFSLQSPLGPYIGYKPFPGGRKHARSSKWNYKPVLLVDCSRRPAGLPAAGKRHPVRQRYRMCRAAALGRDKPRPEFSFRSRRIFPSTRGLADGRRESRQSRAGHDPDPIFFGERFPGGCGKTRLNLGRCPHRHTGLKYGPTIPGLPGQANWVRSVRDPTRSARGL